MVRFINTVLYDVVGVRLEQVNKNCDMDIHTSIIMVVHLDMVCVCGMPWNI